MRRWRDGTGGKRKKRKIRCSRAPVAGSAAFEHRTFTIEVGQISKPKHRPSIRSGSLLTGHGRIDHPASVHRRPRLASKYL
jgi:hypothetical protein